MLERMFTMSEYLFLISNVPLSHFVYLISLVLVCFWSSLLPATGVSSCSHTSLTHSKLTLHRTKTRFVFPWQQALLQVMKKVTVSLPVLRIQPSCEHPTSREPRVLPDRQSPAGRPLPVGIHMQLECLTTDRHGSEGPSDQSPVVSMETADATAAPCSPPLLAANQWHHLVWEQSTHTPLSVIETFLQEISWDSTTM